MEATINAQWRVKLENLVQRFRPEDVVRALDECPVAFEVLKSGFGAPLLTSQRVSFASYCLRRNRVDVWRAVVREAVSLASEPATRMVATLSVPLFSYPPNKFLQRTTPHEAAIVAACPEGLRFALEYDSSATALVSTAKSGHSLLSLAWRRVLRPRESEPESYSSAGGPVDDFTRAAACCRILLDHNAPWYAKGSGSTGAADEAMRLVCTERWTLEQHQTMVELLSAFKGAGRLDLNAPLQVSGLTLNGMTPLYAAASSLEPLALKALIALGADTAAALPESHPHHGDLAGMVMSYRRESSAECAAAITEALMARAINTALTSSAATVSKRPRAARL